VEFGVKVNGKKIMGELESALEHASPFSKGSERD
jgi:hypothetical protein